jgi:DNA modification methylase
MKSELVKGDSLKVLKKYEDNSIDLLCTDPPYGYSFMGRDWDKTLPPKEIFEECFRVLKPGSMAFVMSAPRSDVQYRMAEMLEKVGFRIDYTPIYWTYASGFPKAMNIGKMLDKRQGNKREEVEDPQSAKRNKTKSDREVYGDYKDTDYKVTKGNSELEGSYGGFQPKPAVEVVIVAMKPLDKKGYLEQALDNGKGVTWFDDCRIPFEEGYVEPENQTMPDLRDVGKKSKEAIGIDKLSFGQVENAKRKPYKEKPISSLPTEELIEKFGSIENYNSWKKENTKHWPKGGFGAMDIGIGKPGETQNYKKKDGTESRGWNNSRGYGRDSEPKTTKRQPRTEGSVFKESGFKSENNDTAEANPMGRFPANLLVSDDIIDDGKITKSSGGRIGKKEYATTTHIPAGQYQKGDPGFGDIGGYSRYFSLDAWFEKNLESLPEPVQQTFPFMIVPKASKAEKNDGLDNFDEQFKAGADFRPNHKEKALKGEDGNPYGRWNKIKNIHPTVKPLKLMNYLVTLGSRKGDVVLDPFMGSGTTPLACISLERKYIGIDNEEDYYKIAKARVDKLEYPLKMWEKFT